MFACAEHAASASEVTMFKGGLSPPPTNEEPQITWKEKGRKGRVGWELNNLSREKGIEVGFGP